MNPQLIFIEDTNFPRSDLQNDPLKRPRKEVGLICWYLQYSIYEWLGW